MSSINQFVVGAWYVLFVSHVDHLRSGPEIRSNSNLNFQTRLRKVVEPDFLFITQSIAWPLNLLKNVRLEKTTAQKYFRKLDPSFRVVPKKQIRHSSSGIMILAEYREQRLIVIRMYVQSLKHSLESEISGKHSAISINCSIVTESQLTMLFSP